MALSKYNFAAHGRAAFCAPGAAKGYAKLIYSFS